MHMVNSVHREMIPSAQSTIISRLPVVAGFLLVFLIRVYCSSASESVMEKHQVVPDVIPKAPKAIAVVKYGDVSVDGGNILTPTQVKDPPTTVSWGGDKSALYTLCLTDPDAPSRLQPAFREWHHWLVVNIPGEDIAQGETLSEYVGAGPPKASGLHRYVYLIYKQPKKIDTSKLLKLTNKSGGQRGNFSTKKFASDHNLGTPVAGNLFQAEYDDYVPILYKQLGF